MDDGECKCGAWVAVLEREASTAFDVNYIHVILDTYYAGVLTAFGSLSRSVLYSLRTMEKHHLFIGSSFQTISQVKSR